MSPTQAPAAADPPSASRSCDSEPSQAPPAGKGHAARRRRLWQLPTQAHELLLAMSFTPEVLRREASRQLGQIHHARCVLKGRDVDVLYSVVHDMVARNPMSEAFHRLLDDKHAIAVRRLTAMREADAVRSAWTSALDADTMPSALWAVLTHPLGESLESTVLYDARAWIFEHGRHGVAMKHAQQQGEFQLQQARQRADALQARLLAKQQEAIDQLGRAQSEIANLRGELARLRQAHAGSSMTAPQPQPPHAEPRRTRPRTEALPRVTASDPPPRPIDAPSTASVPGARSTIAADRLAVRGRRVLCVGGIQHAVARYRGRIEKLGGQFEHHDGGLQDSVQVLDARLCRADVVICQAACINHEAYHRVKRHCERTGTPCLYLDRPSLSRFDRALAQVRGSHESAGT